MGRDLAIDLGTANTLIYRQGDGVVFNEPSVVALDANSGDVVALGEEAWQAIGGTRGSVIAVRPMRHGVMTEYDITEKMVHAMLRRIGLSRFPRPRILVCVPSSSSPNERCRSTRSSQLEGSQTPQYLHPTAPAAETVEARGLGRPMRGATRDQPAL